MFYSPSGTTSEVGPRPGVITIKLVPGSAPAVLLSGSLTANLQKKGFAISKTDRQYGGTDVYMLKRDTLVLYLTLVSPADGIGSLVVLWGNFPQ